MAEHFHTRCCLIFIQKQTILQILEKCYIWWSYFEPIVFYWCFEWRDLRSHYSSILAQIANNSLSTIPIFDNFTFILSCKIWTSELFLSKSATNSNFLLCQDWYFCRSTFLQRYRLCSFVFLFRDWPTKMFWGVRDWNCRKTQECVLPQTFPPSIERQVLPWSIAQYLCQAGIWMIYISSLTTASFENVREYGFWYSRCGAMSKSHGSSQFPPKSQILNIYKKAEEWRYYEKSRYVCLVTSILNGDSVIWIESLSLY